MSNDNRAERILAAAADLISHYGYDKTTVDDIAREAGVSKGAIYLHFSSKEDLFDALILREMEQLMGDIDRRLDSDPRGLTLFTLYRHSMGVVVERPLLRALYSRDRRVMGEYLRRLRQREDYQRMIGFGVEFVRHFQEAGLLRRDVDAETLAYVLGIIRYGFLTIEEAVPSGQMPPLDAIGGVLAEMVERAFAPDDNGANQEAGRAALRALLDQSTAYIRALRADKKPSKNEDRQ